MRSQGDVAGFSLMEVLVVMLILGLLIALTAPAVMGQLTGARGDAARIQLQTLETALDLYALHAGSYPTSAQGLKALVAAPADVTVWRGPYVKGEAMLVDPWGQAFGYRSPGEHGDYDLYSLGSDRREGGEGAAADVTSW